MAPDERAVRIGIEVRGNTAFLGAVDRVDGLIDSRRISLAGEPQDHARSLAAAVAVLTARSAAPVAGVGLVLGPVADAALGVQLASLCRLPVIASPASLCRTWAEALLGAGRGLTHFAFLGLGAEIEGGIVLEGALFHPAGGLDFGHLCVDPDGRVCGCGARGCLQLYAGTDALNREAQALGITDIGPEADAGSSGLGADLARRIAAGDRKVRGLVSGLAGSVGVALGHVTRLTGVGHIVVAMHGHGEQVLLPALGRPLDRRSGRKITLLASHFGDSGGIVGAAWMGQGRATPSDD